MEERYWPFMAGWAWGKLLLPAVLPEGLGVTEGVSSPTFALVHEYSGNIPLYHFDMFRVSGWDDLYSTGFFDYLETDAVLAIEWSENIEGALPEGTIRIEICEGDTESQRVIRISGLKEKLLIRIAVSKWLQERKEQFCGYWH